MKESVLLFITGLSGAGKSTVLDTLEDLGYEVVDNLPLRLLRTLIEESGQTTPLAIGIDSRSAGFSSDFLLYWFRTSPNIVKNVNGVSANTTKSVVAQRMVCHDAWRNRDRTVWIPTANIAT